MFHIRFEGRAFYLIFDFYCEFLLLLSISSKSLFDVKCQPVSQGSSFSKCWRISWGGRDRKNTKKEFLRTIIYLVIYKTKL